MKFEYKIIQIPTSWASVDIAAAEKELNNLGLQGWEALNINVTEAGYYCMLKRPICPDEIRFSEKS